MEKAPDSTEVDPTGHRIAFENDHVRVLEIHQPSGRRLAMHSHPPRVIIAINGYELESTTADGSVTVVERRPGETIWSDGEEHAALIVSEAHTIEVEIKSAR
ncbi:MAG: hypothetical protein BMS9Abin07_0708 [Acidimicrobiia bacterium]|nr:MAG: hypothetical protein BMS9Abin07_0708 [Acidimicrobiia bacterium]